MSSTRTAADNSVLHQHRYASSAEFERGLLANLVAKRCALIDTPADRELIWFIQHLSHQDGGLAAVAGQLLARYPERIGTASMLAIGKPDSKSYTADEVRKIRLELPYGRGAEFPLKGETYTALGKEEKNHQAKKYERIAGRLKELERARLGQIADDASYCDDSQSCRDRKREEERERDEAQKHPSSYPVSALRDFCLQAAKDGLPGYRHCDDKTCSIERELAEMCLDPEWDLAAGRPWYFPRLVETLRDYLAEFVKRKTAGVVVTALGKKVSDTLDFTAYGRGLTLMQGEARTGKSHSARVWCQQHPGLARFIEVPPSNDETSFFRALARGLGLGNFLNYKAAELRERVESVLLTGNLVLVLDEAQRLWPQRNLRYGFPSRIVWVMTMANAGVPVAMVSTPQFIQAQNAVEKTGWNSAQLTGRISHYEALPPNLSEEDLTAVAKAVLPEADAKVLRALAIYAQTSARNLAALDSISKRARWLAEKDGRPTAATEDVRRAMQESVIPADTKLQLALAGGKTRQPTLIVTQEILVPETPAVPEPQTPPCRSARPTAPRRGNLEEITAA